MLMSAERPCQRGFNGGFARSSDNRKCQVRPRPPAEPSHTAKDRWTVNIGQLVFVLGALSCFFYLSTARCGNCRTDFFFFFLGDF